MIFRLTGLNGLVEGRTPKPEPIFAAVPVVAAVEGLIVRDAGAGVVPPHVPIITNAVAINDWELTDYDFQAIRHRNKISSGMGKQHYRMRLRTRRSDRINGH
ncbi:hypothetical protein DAPPUDRAFT_328474 [Daphnia pulex]|uniref:Uncharacterized protein n=1 Tax=Daphnia pulex TaxID=6669 RepID=E9HDS9_DAPPU|nr:hypothetical protein DAPPUDRAFT_328474 [Daphnia pulex]|eukprot:EFX70118.1 hypothetical protein DAPPUDRAFT_328474 [Daphnia pulex]